MTARALTGADARTEYDVDGEWFEMILDDEVIGRCRMKYGSPGWQFEFESDTHELRAGKKLSTEENR
jgi:hypothetical protein